MKPDQFDILVEKRRSIRKFKPERPPEEWIHKMLHCAIQAPSPSNSQPVRYIRIASPGVREKLRETMSASRQKCLRILHEREAPRRLQNCVNFYWRYSEFMFDAPLLFAVGTVPKTSGLMINLAEAGLIESGRENETGLDISLGLSLKGFILKAETLGLGTCVLTAPLGFIPDMNDIIPTHEDLTVKCFLAAGFPEDDNPPGQPRKPVSQIYREV